MALEQLINVVTNFNITLSGNINASVTSLVVSTVTNLPTTPNYRISIDSELMLVTAISGTTLTVIRGIESTTATSHTSGVIISFPLTAGSLNQRFIDNINSGSYSNAPNLSGYLYQCTDAPIMYIGTNLFRSFPIVTQFVNSGFSWVNQGTSTLTSNQGIYNLSGNNTGSSGDNLRSYVISAPATPYYVDFSINVIYNGLVTNNFGHAGFCWRDSGTGKQVTYGIMQSLTASFTSSSILAYEYLSPTAAATSYFTNVVMDPRNYSVLRVQDDGTNHNFFVSADGVNFFKIFSTSRTTYLANPNQIGIFIDPVTTGTTISLLLSHWFVHT